MSRQLKDESAILIGHDTAINISGQANVMAALCIRIFGNATRKVKRTMALKISEVRSEIVSVLTSGPTIVAEKTRISDWEIDILTGRNYQGALVTIVDWVSQHSD